MTTLLLLLALSLGTPEPEPAPERVVLRTSAGDLVLALYPSVAPQHVGQILELVRLGAYDTVDFFRVVPGFIVQLSEVEYRRLPLSEAQRHGIRNIPLELSDRVHRRGMLTMARREEDTASARTSFSILLADSPHLDGKYTIFGHLESGYDVLEEMARVPRDENDRPSKRIEVLKAEVVPSVEALRRTYLAGPRPLTDTAESPLGGFYLAAVGVMIGLALTSFALGGRASRKVHAALSLLVCLVGAFALYVYWAPRSEPNHMHGIAVLLGILALLKLMGKFEHPS